MRCSKFLKKSKMPAAAGVVLAVAATMDSAAHAAIIDGVRLNAQEIVDTFNGLNAGKGPALSLSWGSPAASLSIDNMATHNSQTQTPTKEQTAFIPCALNRKSAAT